MLFFGRAHIYIYIYISEGGGLERQRPLPGNRFVSFVRASGRARARREISSYGYLELFAEGTFLRLRLLAGAGLVHFTTQKTLKPI